MRQRTVEVEREKTSSSLPLGKVRRPLGIVHTSPVSAGVGTNGKLFEENSLRQLRGWYWRWLSDVYPARDAEIGGRQRKSCTCMSFQTRLSNVPFWKWGLFSCKVVLHSWCPYVWSTMRKRDFRCHSRQLRSDSLAGFFALPVGMFNGCFRYTSDLMLFISATDMHWDQSQGQGLLHD